MVNLKIDHNEISVPEGTTIMEAAALAGIDIPKLWLAAYVSWRLSEKSSW